jgi:hypothetical protein
MNCFRYTAVVTLALWTTFTLAGAADAQTLVTSALRAADRHAADNAGLQRAQGAGNERSERGLVRKVLGAAVGATAGFFAGGYLGAAIEGNRCHCDDPGLKGVLIGAPIGAAAGGVLGGLYLF